MEKSIVIKSGKIPGPKGEAFLQRRRSVVSQGVSVGKSQITAIEAKGAMVRDLDDNWFLDFSGGIGCMNVGHSAPSVINAVVEQAQRLQHTCFQVVMYESYVALAEKLISISPGNHSKKVALFNSGAEAVENAIKIARRYTGRQAVVCFDNAFHGRTMTALALTSKVKPYKDGFGPYASEVYQAPFPYLAKKPRHMTAEEYIEDAIARLHFFFKATVTPDRVAAVILEPVLGEGGFLIPPPLFTKELRKICKDNGVVFIADEIQSGFARTGKWFASEHHGLDPDLITCAKSMSAGFPVSAVIGRTEMMDAVQPGGLGGTFAGNPVSCAAALGAIEVIEKEHLNERALIIGQRFRERMSFLSKQFAFIGEVRGLGAMNAFEVVDQNQMPDKDKAEKIVGMCAQQGLLILTAGVEGNVIRTLMPLVISDEQLEEAISVLESVFKKLT